MLDPRGQGEHNGLSKASGCPTITSTSWSIVLPSLTIPSVLPGTREPPQLHSVGYLSGREKHRDGFRSGGRGRDLEEKVRQATGKALPALSAREASRNPELVEKLAGLRLNEYFDDSGKPRFRRLGLSFAAKNDLRTKHSFGSRAASLEPHAKKEPSAKAFIAAETAREKDAAMKIQRLTEQGASITPAERFKAEEVKLRQVEMMFAEVPNFAQYLPPGVHICDLQPEDISNQDEWKERRVMERANMNFDDVAWKEGKEMRWMFSRSEAIAVSKVTGLWTSAAHGGSCPLGMDRPTFCRLVLDLGLVDQDKVPYCWAVSLFDDVAQPVRCCSGQEDAQLIATAPLVQVVSRWHLISVLDTICRQHFNHQTKGAFLGSLLQIARLHLPAYVIEESGLSDKPFAELAAGREVDWGKLSRAVHIASAAFVRQETKGHAVGTQASMSSDGSIKAEGRRATSGSTRGAIDYGSRRLLDAAPLSPPGTSSPAGESVAEAIAAIVSQPTVDAGDAVLPPISRREAINNQLVRSMLVEPEVLHIVAQQRELFLRLHTSYAGEGGDLSFAALCQLFQDFHLSPLLASSHTLQRLYETAECVDFRPRQTTPVARHKSNGALKLANLKGPLVVQPSSRSPSQASSVEESPRMRGSRQAPESKLMGKEPQSPRAQRAPSELPAGSRRSLVATGGANAGPAAALAEAGAAVTAPGANAVGLGLAAWPTPLPWTGIAEVAKRALTDGEGAKLRRCPTRFGADALAEMLCRAAFAYLGGYGSTHQQGMSGYMRVVWLVAYLRNIVHHLRGSLEKRLAGAAGEAVGHEALRSALEGVPDTLWVLPPLPEPLLPLPTSRTGLPTKDLELVARARRRASAGVGSEGGSQGTAALTMAPSTPRTPRSPQVQKDARNAVVTPQRTGRHRSEAAVPLVADGTCRLCQLPAGPQQWGNPRCRGCSIVDRLALRQHPLSALLVGRPMGALPDRKRAQWPPQLERSGLTPPPVLSSNALRCHVKVQDKPPLPQPPCERGRSLS